MTAFLFLAFAVDFATQVAPILEKSCLPCHGPEKALGKLRVDSAAAIASSVRPRQPQQSSLYLRTQLPLSQTGAMPPGGPALTSEESGILRDWIADGAVWPGNFVVGAARRKRADDAALTRELHALLSATPAGEFAAYTQAIPGSNVSYDMLPIPGGEFLMGTPDSERGRGKHEGPQHKVVIEPFWMGKHEVTWDEYRLFMFPKGPGDALADAVSSPTRPYVEMSFGMGINGYPAISMTHHAANKYAQWLSARTGQFYRLPTEAEWEYACRAGTTAAYSFGDDAAQLGEYAWFANNSNDKYQPVDKKKPNAWGLHDMHGNVMEWTLDQYLPNFYAEKHGAAWAKSTKPYPHVARGGSWVDPAAACRCGARRGSDPSWKMQDPQLPKSIWYHTDAQWLGFRLVRPRAVPSADEMHAYWNSGVEQE